MADAQPTGDAPRKSVESDAGQAQRKSLEKEPAQEARKSLEAEPAKPTSPEAEPAKPKTPEAEPAHGARKSLEAEPAKHAAPVHAAAQDAAAKKKRRASMFTEAADVKDLIPAPPEKSDISTLQAFFKEPTIGYQDKSSKNKTQIRRPKLVFDNTYRLESKKPFEPSRVEALIHTTLEELLFDLRYCSKSASATCSQVAEAIRNRVMAFEYERYKLVVHVALGPMQRQGFCIAFKNLGDTTRDSYAQGSYTNHHIFAAASVHAIYYE